MSSRRWNSPNFISHVARYTIKGIKQGEDIASRIVIMLTTFVLVMFGDVYAVTYQVNFDKAAMMKSLVPNLTFTVAMSLYVIFKYKHREKEGGIG